MAIRNIRRGDDPVLRKKSLPITKVDSLVHKILEDMLDTMYDSEGVGLAAPQVGIPKRLIVIDTREEEPLALINPEIISTSGEEVSIEGCLSFPGKAGEVPRALEVTVHALNCRGEKICIKAQGLLARALQHEIDHLDGVLFVDRVLRFVEPEVEKRD